jgi:ASPM-SPD-2-Hydin domain-containing protein/HYDIN/CFA65/VesB family protein
MLNTGVVSFSPTTAPLTFPVQLINTSSPQQTVTLSNDGTSTLSITSIRASGQFQMNTTCGGTLPAGANCSISSLFRPRAAGTKTGLITIIDSASSKPQFVDLTGSATALKVSPASLNFGSQKVGTESAPKKVTATNAGGAAIVISSVSIGGADRKDFSETDDCAGQTIQPKGSCTATVTFDPAKTGARSAGLYFNLPTGSVSPAPAALRGSGT